MSDFDFMQDLGVTKDAIRKFTVFAITLPNNKSPVLLGRNGGEVNKPYFNKVLAAAGKKANALKAGRINAGMLSENRDQDRELYPLHVITGWEDVCDAKGKEVEFTSEKCAEFLQALPDHVFDEVREFYANADNFMGAYIKTEDAIDRGKS